MAKGTLRGALSDNQNALAGTLSGNLLRGYSAYQIAVMHGYIGTEEEWLESLKGKQIELRDNNGVIEWRYEGDEEWQELTNLEALIADVIEESVDKDVAEALAEADFYHLVNELPDDPIGNHIYVLSEEEEDDS